MNILTDDGKKKMLISLTRKLMNITQNDNYYKNMFTFKTMAIKAEVYPNINHHI